MLIGLASDHAGWRLKEFIKGKLKEWGYQVEDFGCKDEKSVDYPDYAWKVIEEIRKGNLERGILFCGTGIGMSIVANKGRGIRAAVCWDEVTARLSRTHNDANVLCLGGRVLKPLEAEKIVKIWLETECEGGRHLRRLKKIEKIERSMRDG